jgi:hypothetical protein
MKKITVFFPFFLFLFILSIGFTGNPITQEVDSDGDGIADNIDNCPTVYNPDQVDSDGDLDGCVSYWKFDMGSGNVIKDFIGENSGIINGATWISGKVKNALNFDGVDDYVEIPYNPILDISEAITIMVWVKWTGFGGKPSIINKRSTDNSPLYYNFVISDETALGRLRWSFFAGGHYRNIDYQWAPNIGQWYFIAVTYNSKASVAKIFIDGNEVRSAEVSGTMATGEVPILIGRSAFDENTFNGAIDEVLIYKKALTANEIQQHYNKSINGYGYLSDGIGDMCDNCPNIFGSSKKFVGEFWFG